MMKFRGKFFYVHTEDLRIDRIDAYLRQRVQNVPRIAVRMHDDVFSVLMREIAVVAVTRQKELFPLFGRDEQSGLRAPIVGDVHPVDVRLRPQFRLLHKIPVQQIAQSV